MMKNNKDDVREFWDRAACGEELYLSEESIDGYNEQASTRYKLEPYILPFASFSKWTDKKVLEIGVGLGADHQQFAQSGAKLWGIDLTEQAIAKTSQRFKLFGLHSNLSVGDAENLDFADNTFDLIYSWGVIHHSPDTRKAASEIIRILKPGGHFRVMIYHKYSMIGFMLWLRYALLVGKPFRSLDFLYSQYLESPGTKAYSIKEAEQLFAGSEDLNIKIELTHGDLLEGSAGQRHEGRLLAFARLLWPRRIIKKIFPGLGLFMLISGQKTA